MLQGENESRERERDSDLPSVGQPGLDLARARSFIWVCHLLALSRELGQSGAAVTGTCITLGCGHCRQQLCALSREASPQALDVIPEGQRAFRGLAQ